MKFLLFAFCLIFGNQLLAQSTLDKKLTDFAEKHDLYGKKLGKLEAIEADSELSVKEKSAKWKKAFAKWDKKDITKEFDAEQELVNSLPDTYYNYQRNIPGYTIEFLLFRMHELEILAQLSDQNSILLEQLLKQQVREKPELSKDVSEITRSVQELFSNSIEGLSNLDQLVEFLTINDPDLVGKDLETKIKAIGNYNQTDWNAYSQYLTKMNMYQAKYALITGLTGVPLYGGVDLSTVLGSTFFDFANNRYALTISDWNQGDYIKYEMFLQEKEIRDFLLMNLLTRSYFETQREKLNLSKVGQQSYKEWQVPGYYAISGFEEHVLSRLKMMIVPKESNMSNIQKLLVAAYNDVYVNFESSSSSRKENHTINIDWNELDLSSDQQYAIDAILSEDIQVTKNGLKLALSNGLFENIEWDLEFKLACYFALYNKANYLARDWNNSEYVINPFGTKEDEITQSFAVLDSIELIQLKEECLKILESTGYSKTRFRITFDGDKVTTVCPYIYETKIIGRIIKKAVSKYSDLGYLSFFVETREIVMPEEPAREMWRGDPTPPPPPKQARRNVASANQEEIVEFPDVDAEFPGGNHLLKDWIKENLIYPDISRELGDQGRVYISFVVEMNGSITGINVMRNGVTDELNREAKRIIRNMPKWTPGQNKGVPVRSRCRVPVTFTL